MYLQFLFVLFLQVVATFAGALVVDRYGRRCLLISSGVIMVLFISALGAYFYVLHFQGAAAASSIQFIPLPSLCIYVLAFSLGFGAIPWLMMSELMAPEVKSLSTSIAGKLRYNKFGFWIRVNIKQGYIQLVKLPDHH